MTPRERFLLALTGGQIDRLPTYVSFTPLAAEQASEWLRTPVEELPDLLDNHVVDVVIDPRARTQGTTSFDLWGIGWDNTTNDGFQIDVHPLADLAALSDYHFPDPDDVRFYIGVGRQIKENCGHRAVLADLGFTLWERYYLLRGYEQAMVDLVAAPALVEDLLDQILEVQVRVARNLISLGIDAGYTGDDFGSQRGMLFSPALWRRYFRPRYEELWHVFSCAGVPVCHHTCGDVRPIIGEMVEIGLDMLSPIQAQAMPLQELADTWGDRLAFWGGVCTQHVLPFGTPAEVRAHVEHCRQTLGRKGRYLIGPSHDLTSDVPRANFLAMLEAMGIAIASAA